MHVALQAKEPSEEGGKWREGRRQGGKGGKWVSLFIFALLYSTEAHRQTEAQPKIRQQMLELAASFNRGKK